MSQKAKDIISQALEHAKRKKVTVFAAASNSGNRGKVAFPASKSDAVICVNSYNGDCEISGFSPPPKPFDKFSILGECVKSTWLQADDSVTKDSEGAAWKYETGTSMATAILASVAALILQFGREHGVNLQYNALESPSGIRQVLSNMSEHGGKYDIVLPWLIFDSDFKIEKMKELMAKDLENC